MRAPSGTSSERRARELHRRAPQREHAFHVIAGFPVRRHASVLFHRALPRVVGREDEIRVRLAEPLGELGEVFDPATDAVPRIERALPIEAPSRARHALHESARLLAGYGILMTVRLDLDDGRDEGGI